VSPEYRFICAPPERIVLGRKGREGLKKKLTGINAFVFERILISEKTLVFGGCRGPVLIWRGDIEESNLTLHSIKIAVISYYQHPKRAPRQHMYPPYTPETNERYNMYAHLHQVYARPT
jgi:hypothetical protein